MSASRPYSPAKTLAALAGFAVLVMVPYLRALRTPQNFEFGGPTMGTSYMVKIAQSRLSERQVRELQDGLEALLATFNRQMSTYDPESTISRFNRHNSDTPFPVPAEFAHVLSGALTIATETRGAFDPTVFPLVELWGFGPTPPPEQRPTPEGVAAARARIGFTNLLIAADGAIRKRRPDLCLDLNALAPGYAVDCMARYLREHGCPNGFVDLSGEVVAWGESAPGHPWRVAIEMPDLNAPVGSQTYRRIELRNRAIATSGDYRNFFEEGGQIYSHVLDPRTGYPVSNSVTSASVMAPDCITADACATALMVMGTEEGLRWIASKTNVTALLLVRASDGRYEAFASPDFPP